MSKFPDSAKPNSLQVIEQCYETHDEKSGSPASSSRTVSSTYSAKDSVNLEKGFHSEGSTAPNSDVEDLEIDGVAFADRHLNHFSHIPADKQNVIVINNLENAASSPRIDTIAIQNSTDIRIGNKTVYNGPVVIKQFLYDDQKRRLTANETIRSENGVANNGFLGKTIIKSCN